MKKSKLKYTKRAEIVAIWLLHHDRYTGQYCSECFNRDVQMHNLKNLITEIFIKREICQFSKISALKILQLYGTMDLNLGASASSSIAD